MTVSPFHLCCGCEGKAKSQAPSVVLQAMEPFYSSMAIISCRIMSVNTAEQLFNMFGFIPVKPCNNRHHRTRSHIPPPSPGYTERPARVQFMLGRVGLYEYHTYTHQRPDSSRPQAARSRVACAKRCGRPHCGHQRMAFSTLMGSAGRPIMASCLSRARRAASSSGVNSKSKRSAFS